MRQRKRLRLAGYDYATTGAYFVTVCSMERDQPFGRIVGDTVELNPLGRIAEDAWHAGDTFHPGVELEAFLVMPDHVHGIVWLDRRRRPPPLPAVVGAFKARASRRAGRPLWQRGYHDRVVRDEIELNALREYIATNPARWTMRHGRAG